MFHALYHAQTMYNIKQAAARAGVTVPVLRAWERRYGIVRPPRTASGYRQFDDVAIDRIRTMRALVDDGWSPSAAAAAILAGEATTLPRTGHADGNAGGLASATETADSTAAGAAREAAEFSERFVAASRSLGVQWRIARDHPAVICNDALTTRLAEAVAAVGLPLERLPSGAGHDAVVMSEVVPVGMLFVRCAGGISHHPAESVDIEDVAAAIAVLDRFLDGLRNEKLP